MDEDDEIEKEIERLDELFGDLAGKLLENDVSDLNAFVDAVDATEHNAVANALLGACISRAKREASPNQRFMPLVFAQSLIKNEFEKVGSNQASSVMRGNNLGTAYTSAFARLISPPFLRWLLTPTLDSLVDLGPASPDESPAVSFELDPNRLSDPDEAQINADSLKMYAQSIIDRLCGLGDRLQLLDQQRQEQQEQLQQNTLHQDPIVLARTGLHDDQQGTPLALTMRVLLSFIGQEAAAHQFSDEQQSALLGGYLFLRLVNPALVSPELSGLVPQPPSMPARRNLMVLSKLLQNVSNGAPMPAATASASPAVVDSLNQFIARNAEKLRQFFNVCLLTPEAALAAEQQAQAAAPHLAQVAHYDVQLAKAYVCMHKRRPSALSAATPFPAVLTDWFEALTEPSDLIIGLKAGGSSSSLSTTGSYPAAPGAGGAAGAAGGGGKALAADAAAGEPSAESGSKSALLYDDFLKAARTGDLSDMRSCGFVSLCGTDVHGHPVALIDMEALPRGKHVDRDRILQYLILVLDPLVSQGDYAMVLLYHKLDSDQRPPFAWLKRCYFLFSRKFKKNLKKLYMVDAATWIKLIMKTLLSTVVSKKFAKKLHYVSRDQLSDFGVSLAAAQAPFDGGMTVGGAAGQGITGAATGTGDPSTTGGGGDGGGGSSSGNGSGTRKSRANSRATSGSGSGPGSPLAHAGALSLDRRRDILRTVPLLSIERDRGRLLQDCEGPSLLCGSERESGLAVPRRLGARTVSTYPLTRDGRGRLGDPIADRYAAQVYNKLSIAVVADGCGWGQGPAAASRAAARKFVASVADRMANTMCTTTKDLSAVLVDALLDAHQAVLDLDGDRGTTTLCGGVLVPLARGGKYQGSGGGEWVFVFVSVGDCKIYRYRYDDEAAAAAAAAAAAQNGGSIGDSSNDAAAAGFKPVALPMATPPTSTASASKGSPKLGESGRASTPRTWTRQFAASVQDTAGSAAGAAGGGRHLVQDLTADFRRGESTDSSLLASDPGGRIGGTGAPDLRNLGVGMCPVSDKDTIFIVSDGIHDCTDPQLLGLPPSHRGTESPPPPSPPATGDDCNKTSTGQTALFDLDLQPAEENGAEATTATADSASKDLLDLDSLLGNDAGSKPSDAGQSTDTTATAVNVDQQWEQLTLMEARAAKKKFQQRLLARLVAESESREPAILARALTDYSVGITESLRRFMQMNPKKKQPPHSTDTPGKPDHATCVALSVPFKRRVQ